MFTQEQINELRRNENVSKCSAKSITYSKDFKLLAVKRYYEEGCGPNMIFQEAGFNLDVLGKNRPKECLRSWRRLWDKKGEKELMKENRGGFGRGKKKLEFKSKDEEIEYLRAKVAYMNAENDFLAKLRGLKRE